MEKLIAPIIHFLGQMGSFPVALISFHFILPCFVLGTCTLAEPHGFIPSPKGHVPCWVPSTTTSTHCMQRAAETVTSTTFKNYNICLLLLVSSCLLSTTLPFPSVCLFVCFSPKFSLGEQI